MRFADFPWRAGTFASNPAAHFRIRVTSDFLFFELLQQLAGALNGVKIHLRAGGFTVRRSDFRRNSTLLEHVLTAGPANLRISRRRCDDPGLPAP